MLKTHPYALSHVHDNIAQHSQAVENIFSLHLQEGICSREYDQTILPREYIQEQDICMLTCESPPVIDRYVDGLEASKPKSLEAHGLSNWNALFVFSRDI